jgi:hypothetical protein
MTTEDARLERSCLGRLFGDRFDGLRLTGKEADSLSRWDNHAFATVLLGSLKVD